jgi:hypothetical protein
MSKAYLSGTYSSGHFARSRSAKVRCREFEVDVLMNVEDTFFFGDSETVFLGRIVGSHTGSLVPSSAEVLVNGITVGLVRLVEANARPALRRSPESGESG